MTSYAGFSLITNDGSQDRTLTREKPLFDMCAIDIFKLDTWQIERGLLHHHLAATTRLPNVLGDIIIAYAGSTHADALAIIGRRLPRSTVARFSNTRDRHIRKAMHCLLIKIAKLIGCSYAKLPEMLHAAQDCIKLVRRVADYDDWPDESAGPRVADLFYAILML